MPMVLVEPFDLAAAQVVVSRGSGAANLVSDDPREVWLDGAASGLANIDIDLGSDLAWDTIALINGNGRIVSPVATWVITTGTAAQASYVSTSILASSNMRAASEEISDANGPAAFWRSSPFTSRYIRLAVTQGAGGPAHTIGRVVVGKSWQPTWPREFGAGRPPLDSGSRSRLDNGGLARTQGNLVSGFEWTFGDLDSSDLKKLWGILRRRKTTLPMLLLEDTAALEAESIHYGTFVDLERYERREEGKSRWAAKFEDWL